MYYNYKVSGKPKPQKGLIQVKGILIGAMHKDGTFTDDNGNAVDYNNLVLVVQKPIELSQIAGRVCEGVGFTTTEAKCPWQNFETVFGGRVKSLADLEGYVGTEISYYFDDKKKLDTVLL